MPSLFERYEAARQAGGVRPTEPRKARDGRSNLRRGISAGIDQTQALGYGLVAAAGDLANRAGVGGGERLTELGVEGYQRNMVEAMESEGDVSRFTDIESVGDAASWAAFELGRAIPTLATVIGTGGVAGAAGQVAARKAAKAVLAKQIERRTAALVATGLSEKAAVKGATKAITKRAVKAGGIAGFALPSVGLSTGGIMGQIEEETGQLEGPTALAFGTVAGMLDTAPLMLMARRATSPLTEGVQEGIWKRVSKQALRGMRDEGATEGVQTLIEQAAVDYVQDNLGAFSKEDLTEALNAMAAGALVGGVLGAGGGALSSGNAQAADPTLDTEAELSGIEEELAEGLDDPSAVDGLVSRAEAASERYIERLTTEARARVAEGDQEAFIRAQAQVREIRDQADGIRARGEETKTRLAEAEQAAKQREPDDQSNTQRSPEASRDTSLESSSNAPPAADSTRAAETSPGDVAAESARPAGEPDIDLGSGESTPAPARESDRADSATSSEEAQTATPAPILAGDGKPWRTEKAAYRALRRQGLEDTHRLTERDGGFVLEPARVTLTDENPSITIDVAANEAATSPTNDRPEPTEAQKEAGNYRVGKVRLHGMDVSIENPRGSERKGVDPSGKPWSVKMRHHYGYVRGSEAIDGDHVDVFLTEGAEDASRPVFVVDQVDPGTGKYDEPKAIIGAKTEAEARKAYLDGYSKGWKGLGAITEMPLEEFKAWAKSPDAKRPASPAIQTGEGNASTRPAGPDSGSARGRDLSRPEAARAARSSRAERGGGETRVEGGRDREDGGAARRGPQRDDSAREPDADSAAASRPRGLTPGAVEKVVKRVSRRWRNAPEIRVVESLSEVSGIPAAFVNDEIGRAHV